MRTHRFWTVLAIAIAALVLGLGTTATLHAAGLFARHGPYAAAPGVVGPGMMGPAGRQGPYPAGPASCPAPALPGSVVDVTTTDMGAMMGPGMMGQWGPGMMGPGANGTYLAAGPGGGYSWPGMGMMRLLVNPSTVPAGQVSLRVTNTGAMTHEVVVLPLVQGQPVGRRVSGPDGKIDESGSLGGAARTCGAGDGEGIAAGATSWTSLTLTPGRYELVCNIAGHYWAGTYAELDVTGQPK